MKAKFAKRAAAAQTMREPYWFPVVAESEQDKLREERAELEPQTHGWMARGREANLELGRLFIQIKATLKHGRRQPHRWLRISAAKGGKNDGQNKQKGEFEAHDEQDTLR
jgi:hypothetical protein